MGPSDVVQGSCDEGPVTVHKQGMDPYASAHKRARLSLSAPSHSNENSFVPKKRGVSLGGTVGPLQMLATGAKRNNSSTEDITESLSPRKIARRSLVPGRSILRKSFAGPLAFAEDVTQTLNLTQATEVPDQTDADLRKSFSRRVSFAPTAHMRYVDLVQARAQTGSDGDASEFNKEAHEEGSSEAEASPVKVGLPATQVINRRSSLARFEDAMEAESEEMSMDMAETSVTAAFAAHGMGHVHMNDLMDETQPDFGDDSTMDLASAEVTAAFAVSAAIQARSSLAPANMLEHDRVEGAQPEADMTATELPPSSSSGDEEVAVALGIAAHIEYNVPLGRPGIGPPSNGSDPQDVEPADFANSSDEDVTMEMSLDAGHTGLIVEDGFTSRRLSTSGAVRRASLAPGHAALAMLEAEEEDEEETTNYITSSQLPHIQATPTQRNPGTPTAAAMTPSRIPVSTQQTNPSTSSSMHPSLAVKHISPDRPSASEARPLDVVERPADTADRPPPPPQPIFTTPVRAGDEVEDKKTTTQPLSLDHFLDLADVQFMESMFTGKRKSLSAASGGNSAASLKTRISLAEQIVAASVTLPMLDTLNGMTRELRSSLQAAHQFLEKVETGISQGDVPGLFIEFQAATQGQRDLMTAHLKTSKNLYRTEVRSDWYDYRVQCLTREGGVIDSLQDNLARLEGDRIMVRRTQTDLSAVLPALQEREHLLRGDLARERTRQRELENCDQEHLGSLREAVAEQGAQLEEQMREQHDAEQELARLEAKLSEIEARRTEATAAIARARTLAEDIKCFTHMEVHRLRYDLEAQQELQAYRVLEFNASEIKLIHCNELGILIRLESQGASLLELDRLIDPARYRDEWQCSLMKVLVDRMKRGARGVFPVPELLRSIANQWNLAQRLLAETTLLRQRFPVTMHLVSKRGEVEVFTLRITARIFDRSRGVAFNMRFDIADEELLAGDPEAAIEAVACSVEPICGHIDVKELAYVARERVSRGGRGALLEAAQEAGGELIV